VLQRSATKARTQEKNRLRSLLVTAPDDLRARLRDLTQCELLQNAPLSGSAATTTTSPRSPASGCVSSHSERSTWLSGSYG